LFLPAGASDGRLFGSSIMEFITCTVPSGGGLGDGVGDVVSSSFVILGGEGPDDFPN
jgi:hypothetical protein